MNQESKEENCLLSTRLKRRKIKKKEAGNGPLKNGRENRERKEKTEECLLKMDG